MQDTVLVVDGALEPTRNHTIVERSENCRCSAHHQVVVDADQRLGVVVGQSVAGNRDDCRSWEEPGAAEVAVC